MMVRPAPAVTEARLRRTVGIGEAVVDASGASLAALGLGSCVGLSAWDPVTRIGGLAHFMLPTGVLTGNPAKYVNTGLPWFLKTLTDAGASLRRSQFKAAGGAAMFIGVSASLEVGRRNVVALDQALAAVGLRLTARDLGGATGRSIELDLRTGRLSVRTIHEVSIL